MIVVTHKGNGTNLLLGGERKVKRSYYRSIRLWFGVADEIDKIIESRPELNYQSRTHFVREAVSVRLQQIQQGFPPEFMHRWNGTAFEFILGIMKGAEKFRGPRLEKDFVILQAVMQGMPLELAEKTVKKLMNDGFVFMPTDKMIVRTEASGDPGRSRTDTGKLLRTTTREQQNGEQPLNAVDVKPEIIPEFAGALEVVSELRKKFGYPDGIINQSGVILYVWYTYRLTVAIIAHGIGEPGWKPFAFDCPPILMPMLVDIIKDTARRTQDYARQWHSLIKEIRKDHSKKRTDLI